MGRALFCVFLLSAIETPPAAAVCNWKVLLVGSSEITEKNFAEVALRPIQDNERFELGPYDIERSNSGSLRVRPIRGGSADPSDFHRIPADVEQIGVAPDNSFIVVKARLNGMTFYDVFLKGEIFREANDAWNSNHVLALPDDVDFKLFQFAPAPFALSVNLPNPIQGQAGVTLVRNDSDQSPFSLRLSEPNNVALFYPIDFLVQRAAISRNGTTVLLRGLTRKDNQSGVRPGQIVYQTIEIAELRQNEVSPK